MMIFAKVTLLFLTFGTTRAFLPSQPHLDVNGQCRRVNVHHPTILHNTMESSGLEPDEDKSFWDLLRDMKPLANNKMSRRGLLFDALVSALFIGAYEKGSTEISDVQSEDIQLDIWNKGFEDLQEFRREFGHCLVPLSEGNPVDPTLQLWVLEQREMFHNGQLDSDRKKKLEEIDFEFKP